MQYLKLLSVTMMLSAAYVADADGQDSRMQAFYDAREIILDQIHQINSQSVEEGIEWEMALEVTSNLNQSSVLYQLPEVQNFFLEVLSVKKKLPFDQLLCCPVMHEQQVLNYQFVWFEEENIISPQSVMLANYPVRAGPLA